MMNDEFQLAPLPPDADTAEMLEERVLAAEHLLYPRVLSEFVHR